MFYYGRRILYTPPSLLFRSVNEMNEKNYKRKLEFQEKLIKRQSEQIDLLNSQIDKLKLECEEKDRIIHSVSSLKDDLAQNVSEVKKYKEEYKKLITELRKMKAVMNQEVFKGKWRLIKLLIK